MLFSKTFRYRTSRPLLVNIRRLKFMLKGGRLQLFWLVMLVSSASADSTNSDCPVNLPIFQTMLFSDGSYLALPWVQRSEKRAVFRGVGMRTTTLVAKSLEPKLALTPMLYSTFVFPTSLTMACTLNGRFTFSVAR